MKPIKQGTITKGLASQTTYSTCLTRVALAGIIMFASMASMFYVVTLGIDQVYVVRNKQNVYYTSSTDASAPATLLLPQIDATVGLVTACVSRNCFARTGLQGVQSMVNDTLQKASVDVSGASGALKQLSYEFMFGYDAASHCGTTPARMRSIAQFGYAAYALSLAFFIALCAVSMCLCLVLGDQDVLAGTPKLDANSNAITVQELGLSGTYVMQKLQRHLKYEQPLLISVEVLSCVACAMSLMSMAITVALDTTTTKCGSAICTSFKKHLTDVYDAMAGLGYTVSTPRQHSCHTGASFPLSIVGFVAGCICVVLAGLLFFWYYYTERRREMLKLRDQLYRLADVQGLMGTISNGDATCPLARSRQPSQQLSGLVVDGASGLFRSDGVGGGVGERGALGNVSRFSRSNSLSLSRALQARGVSFSGVESEDKMARSVGARIELYRSLKQFAKSEEQVRRNVLQEENFAFQSLMALREKLWYDEELRMLHEFTLDWFVAPILDLCVLETNARQLLIQEYTEEQTELLFRITTGFNTPSDSTQAWDEKEHLTVAEATWWTRQVMHWQEEQSEMAPSFSACASYRQCDTTPPPQRQKQQRRGKSPRKSELGLPAQQQEPPPAAALSTDAWLTRWEELRTVNVDVPFLPSSNPRPSPAPRRSTTFTSLMDDNSSFSSNVFSAPSFALVQCSAFAVPDAVRVHLSKAGYLKRPPLQAPPRLLVLPQHSARQQRSRHSSGSHRRSSNGSRHHHHHGTSRRSSRSASSSQAVNESMPSAPSGTNQPTGKHSGGGEGENRWVPMRTVSKREGESAERSPCQTAMSNATATPSPSTGSKSSGLANGSFPPRVVTERTNTSPVATQDTVVPTDRGTAYPASNAWRTYKAA